MKNKICPKCKIENPLAASFCRHCGHSFSEESKKGSELSPKINEFLILESFYTIGSVINLMWEVDNYTKITLNGEDVTNHDSYEFIVNGDAVIEKKEFIEMLHQLKLKEDIIKSAEAMYKDLDLNNDSVISFNEFLQIFKDVTCKKKSK